MREKLIRRLNDGRSVRVRHLLSYLPEAAIASWQYQEHFPQAPLGIFVHVTGVLQTASRLQ